MRKNSLMYLLAVLVVLFLVPDTSDAQLFRRWRRRGGGGRGIIMAPLATIAKPIVGVIRNRSGIERNEYDYNWAARRDWHKDDAKQVLFADRVRIRVLLSDRHTQIWDQLKVRATWAYLHKSKTKHIAWTDLQRDGDDFFYDVAGLEEGRVVKVTSDFYEKTNSSTSSGDSMMNVSFIKNEANGFKRTGRMHVPYYGVTSSESNEELKRRARIVSFSFSQWYADEAYGGRFCDYNCYSFYHTSTSGELNGFELQPVAHADVPRLSKQGKRFHGDYLIMSGHYGMALCYDEDTEHFITIEGNYALNGPYRINIDPYYHGLYVWGSILTISEEKQDPASLD